MNKFSIIPTSIYVAGGEFVLSFQLCIIISCNLYAQCSVLSDLYYSFIQVGNNLVYFDTQFKYLLHHSFHRSSVAHFLIKIVSFPRY